MKDNIAIIQDRCRNLLDPFDNYENIFESFIESKNFLFYGIFYFYRLLRKFKCVAEIPEYIFFNSSWRKNVKNYDYWIIFYSNKADTIASYIKKRNNNAKILYYFWDINTKFDSVNYADAIVSFDRQFALTYKTFFIHQFYSNKQFYPVQHIIYDYCWLGRVKKGREEEVKKIRNLVSPVCSGYWKDIPADSEGVDYVNEYLKIVQQSKCLIEIVIDGQTGLTLRSLEALFYNKKLLTNNKNIRNYDFYNPNNIFIMNHDEDFIDWLNKEYEPVAETKKQTYTLDSFLSSSYSILNNV